MTVVMTSIAKLLQVNCTTTASAPKWSFRLEIWTTTIFKVSTGVTFKFFGKTTVTKMAPKRGKNAKRSLLEAMAGEQLTNQWLTPDSKKSDRRPKNLTPEQTEETRATNQFWTEDE
jgi:hypothetical protein